MRTLYVRGADPASIGCFRGVKRTKEGLLPWRAWELLRRTGVALAMTIRPLALVPCLALVAAPAFAVDPPTVSSVTVANGEGRAILLFTAGPGEAGEVPARIEDATIGTGADRHAVTLELADANVGQRVEGGGFLRAAYRFVLPAGLVGETMLRLPSGSAFAFTAPTADTRLAEAAPPSPAVPAPTPAIATPERPGNAFLANLSAYNPVYIVAGRGTDTDAKVQISLKYQLLGNAAHPTGDWKEGFFFGYTQRMFWDIAANSAPFRDVDYQPEFFYLHALPAWGGVPLTVQGGYLHQSNGRSGAASRAYNIVYVQPMAELALDGSTLTVGPRLYAYVLGRRGNEDIADYRGHQSLALSFGREDGLLLSTTSRLNFGTGKGAIEGELSYPLDRLLGIPLYVMAQGFTGYGEDLRDYDRRQSRLRFGLGIAR